MYSVLANTNLVQLDSGIMLESVSGTNLKQ